MKCDFTVDTQDHQSSPLDRVPSPPPPPPPPPLPGSWGCLSNPGVWPFQACLISGGTIQDQQLFIIQEWIRKAVSAQPPPPPPGRQAVTVCRKTLTGFSLVSRAANHSAMTAACMHCSVSRI